MNRKCVICGDAHNKAVFKEFNIYLLRCKNCGHVFSSHQSDQYYDGYFGDLDGAIEEFWRFWCDEAHEKMYADFVNRFISGESGSLLDFGCGPGYFIKRISSFPNWEVFGYEISATAVKYAQDKLGLSNIFSGKYEESPFPQKYFDIITLWDVIEHIPNPDPVLSYLSSILKDKGMLFICTPNIQVQLPKARIKKILKGMNTQISYIDARDHINIYSMRTLGILLRHNGFNQLKFIHLFPIQGIAGSKNPILSFVKNVFYYLSRILFAVTLGKINIDNLFVIARK